MDDGTLHLQELRDKNLKEYFQRVGLKKYPDYPYAVFELPVRYYRNKYQVWNGKRWYDLEVKGFS